MSKSTRSSKAYLLFELIVSLALFSVCLATVIQAMSFCVKQSRFAADYMQGVRIASAKLQEGEFMAKNRRVAGVFCNPPDSKFPWSLRISPDADTGYMRIDVAVSWKSPDNSHKLEFYTLIK